jgi:hypothetical protein
MSRRTIPGQAAGVSDAAAAVRPRLRGAELRRALAASFRSNLGRGRRTRDRLGPGERIIDGRVYYSAAWLDDAPVHEQRCSVVKPEHREGLLLAQTSSPRRSLEAERRHDLERVE